MMDVKKALDEADGDREKATEILRVKGLKGVTKREGRSASNGLVTAHVDGGVGTLVEVNCETDFVAKGAKFIALADAVLASAVASKASNAAELLNGTIDGKSVQEVLDEANATIGEKIEVRHVARDVVLAGIVRNLEPDSLVLVATHLVHDLEPVLDSVVIMRHGRTLLTGDVDDLRAEHGASIEAIFKEMHR